MLKYRVALAVQLYQQALAFVRERHSNPDPHPHPDPTPIPLRLSLGLTLTLTLTRCVSGGRTGMPRAAWTTYGPSGTTRARARGPYSYPYSCPYPWARVRGLYSYPDSCPYPYPYP